jgi:hypothetical protein
MILALQNGGAAVTATATAAPSGPAAETDIGGQEGAAAGTATDTSTTVDVLAASDGSDSSTKATADAIAATLGGGGPKSSRARSGSDYSNAKAVGARIRALQTQVFITCRMVTEMQGNTLKIATFDSHACFTKCPCLSLSLCLKNTTTTIRFPSSRPRTLTARPVSCTNREATD